MIKFINGNVFTFYCTIGLEIGLNQHSTFEIILLVTAGFNLKKLGHVLSNTGSSVPERNQPLTNYSVIGYKLGCTECSTHF